MTRKKRKIEPYLPLVKAFCCCCWLLIMVGSLKANNNENNLMNAKNAIIKKLGVMKKIDSLEYKLTYLPFYTKKVGEEYFISELNKVRKLSKKDIDKISDEDAIQNIDETLQYYLTIASYYKTYINIYRVKPPVVNFKNLLKYVGSSNDVNVNDSQILNYFDYIFFIRVGYGSSNYASFVENVQTDQYLNLLVMYNKYLECEKILADSIVLDLVEVISNLNDNSAMMAFGWVHQGIILDILVHFKLTYLKYEEEINMLNCTGNENTNKLKLMLNNEKLMRFIEKYYYYRDRLKNYSIESFNYYKDREVNFKYFDKIYKKEYSCSK